MAATSLAPELVAHEHAFRWRAHLPQFRDPDFASLRRATRAALLVPTVFAMCAWLLPEPQLATFATFGTFALTVLGDFGGPSRRRVAAYALTMLVGWGLLILGTLASGNPWSAAAAILIAGFALQFAGLFGGYISAAQMPLLLGMVLAVAIPAGPDALAQRLAGWAIGSLLALVGGVWLWPRHEHAALRLAAADACQALADLVLARFGTRVAHAEIDRQQQRAQAALNALRQAYTVTPQRPTGPTRQNHAFAELVDELGRGLKFASLTASSAEPELVLFVDEHNALTEAVVEVLGDSARVLRGEGGAPDLARLTHCREEYRLALNAWAAEKLRAKTDASTVLDGLEAGRPLKLFAFVALAIGANATLGAGRRLDTAAVVLPPGVEVASGLSAGIRRVAAGISTHLTPSSIWWRNSSRAAIGLAIAVLVVGLLGLDHAFWGVLGTLSVLRSNALATGRTALAAIVGTTLGILPASLLLVPLGTNSTVLWIAFPCTVFLAAYAPSVIGFVVGQAAFTLLVIVLFNLIQPVGWTLGLVRLQDVLVGAGLSLAVGTLLWPSGARGQLSTALGALYQRDAVFLRTAFGFVLGHSAAEECRAARHVAAGQAERVAEVFGQFLNERSAKVLPLATWAALPAGGSHLLLAGDHLEHLATNGYRLVTESPAASTLTRSAEAVVGDIGRLAESLERRTVLSSSPGPEVEEHELRQVAVAGLRAWAGVDDPVERGAALAIVETGNWIHWLGLIAAHLRSPAAAAVRVANLPWWH